MRAAVLLLALAGCVDYGSLSSGEISTDLGSLDENPPADLAAPACTPVGGSCPSGSKCTLADGAFRCMPTGVLAEGALCSPSSDQCAAGLLCSGDFPGTPATCHRMCLGNTDCPQLAGPGGDLPQCIIPLTATTAVRGCSKSCNPLVSAANNLCASGLKCVIDINVTVCVGAKGSGVAGSACSVSEECAQGYDCLTTGHCVANCLTANDCNFLFETCTARSSGGPYGVCCSSSGC